VFKKSIKSTFNYALLPEQGWSTLKSGVYAGAVLRAQFETNTCFWEETFCLVYKTFLFVFDHKAKSSSVDNITESLLLLTFPLPKTLICSDLASAVNAKGKVDGISHNSFAVLQLVDVVCLY